MVKENTLMNPEETAGRIFREALRAVDPSLIVRNCADEIRSRCLDWNFTDLIVTGFGKASCRMAAAVEETLGTDMISRGLVVTKYGHINGRHGGLKKIKACEAGHPIPDGNGLRAAGEIINLLRDADERTLVLCLVSGGGSALFVSPYNGITLHEKQEITDLLLRAGADITELNAVRKHISAVKGGRLAEIAYPAGIVSLMISDVIGDKIDVIASGPTAPDTSTYRDALDVINKFNLAGRAPAAVMDVLNRGGAGELPETPKEGNPVFSKVVNTVIGSNRRALEAAERKALSLGLDAEIISYELTGEAREAGKRLAEKAVQYSGPKCLISGGETTVTVRGKGKGGRNTELALSFAMEIEGIDGITLLSAGTDGTDGPTDAAGAIVDGRTVAKAKSMGLDPAEFLENNDSYNFFRKTGSLLITGPTGTNVMDVQIICRT